MATLPSAIADPDVVIALDPSELGKTLLRLAERSRQNNIFSPAQITGSEALFPVDPGRPHYDRRRHLDLEIAIGEAWHWLELNMLIMPAPEPNGRNGWKVLTRRGLA